ncbi:enhancer of polycomb-like-domain-containing protein [Hyaloraphidium curvatum]|nr:enhancer of polycomb-like-domain-containing protein [Hyaloraphidium curvatum]
MASNHGRSGGGANKQTAFRSRKIDVRKPLPVYRESDLAEKEELNNSQLVPVATTGVEKEEEEESISFRRCGRAGRGADREEHLQLALATHYGSEAKTFIPVPEADRPFDDYDKFYNKPFVLSKTLIRFSAPIEEWIGCPYNMDGVDDAWLADHNARCDRGEVSKHARLTEDQFEELMWGLEKITQEKNWVDPWSNKFSPHLGEMATLEDLETYLKTSSALLPSSRQIIKHPNLKAAAAAVFAHWQERRKQRDNRPIQPTIKTEDTGANDAYICFRRRENRPMRKTRRVDQQSMDKVRQLRQQMDQARNLLDLVTKRERYRKESLILEELIFQQKIVVRRMKKKLGVSAAEDASPVKQAKAKKPEDRPMGPMKILLKSTRDASLLASDQAAEARKRKREEDERLGWMDLTENPYVPMPPTHAGDRFFREDYTDILSYPSPSAEDGVVPTFLMQAGDPAADFNVPFLPDPDVEEGRKESILRARMGRVRIGRGGRRIHDRRCGMGDVFPEMGPQHAWLPGEPESRWKPAPNFEMENEAKLRQENQEKLSRFRWGDTDDEELAILADDAGMPIYDNTSALLLRYSLIGELEHKLLEVVPRIPQQAEPRISGLRTAQPNMPPPQVVRPQAPVAQQQQQQQQQQQAQQQAQQASKKKQAVARLSSEGMAALAAGQAGQAQLALNKAAGKPIKGEEDPKAAAVKILMREAAKGAQQIQQMSSQLQAQARTQQQNAIQNGFQPQLQQAHLQQALPLLANQMGAQNTAGFVGSAHAALASPSLSASLGSPVLNSAAVQQSPGSPALNGQQVLSPTKLAAQGMKNSLITAGVLANSPTGSPGTPVTAPGAGSAIATASSTASSLQQQQAAAAQQQRVNIMRQRQQQTPGGAQPAQASVSPQQSSLYLQQQLGVFANQIRSGQLKVSGNVPVVLNPNGVTFTPSNGVHGSPPRPNAANIAAQIPQQIYAQLQQRMALAGNPAFVANASMSPTNGGIAGSGQLGVDGAGADDDDAN